MLRLKGVATLAILATVFAGPRAASAAEPRPWTMAPCATATLGATRLDSSVPWFVIFGEAVQCAPTVAGGGVRLAVYRPGSEIGTSAGYHVRVFGTTDVGMTREFGAAVIQPVSGEYGVCALAAEHTRLSCVRVTISEDRRTATTQRLDVADPLVTKEVRADAYEGSVYPPGGKGTNPACGTCF